MRTCLHNISHHLCSMVDLW